MYKPKILVVEDDPAITNLIRTTLDTQEYQYHNAKNGAGALLDAVSYNPDVIILDLGLPDMDGVEIIRKVRGWSSVPIIIVMSTEQTPVFFAAPKYPAMLSKLAKGRTESYGDSARGPTWQSHEQRFPAALQ